MFEMWLNFLNLYFKVIFGEFNDRLNYLERNIDIQRTRIDRLAERIE